MVGKKTGAFPKAKKPPEKDQKIANSQGKKIEVNGMSYTKTKTKAKKEEEEKKKNNKEPLKAGNQNKQPEEQKIQTKTCQLCAKLIKVKCVYTPKCKICFYCEICLKTFEKFKEKLNFCLDCCSYFRRFLEKPKNDQCTLCSSVPNEYNLLCQKHRYCLDCYTFIESNEYSHIKTISSCYSCKSNLKTKQFKPIRLPGSDKQNNSIVSPRKLPESSTREANDSNKPNNSIGSPRNYPESSAKEAAYDKTSLNQIGSPRKNTENSKDESKFLQFNPNQLKNPQKTTGIYDSKSPNIKEQKIGSPRKSSEKYDYERKNVNESINQIRHQPDYPENQTRSPDNPHNYLGNPKTNPEISNTSQIIAQNKSNPPFANQIPLSSNSNIAANYSELQQNPTINVTIDTFHLRAMNSMSSCTVCCAPKTLTAFLCNHNVCIDCLTLSCCQSIMEFFLVYQSNRDKIFEKFSYSCPKADCRKSISIPTRMILVQLEKHLQANNRAFETYRFILDYINCIPYFDGLEPNSVFF